MEPKLNTSKDALRRQNMIREIFNDVIMCKDITPDVWKRVRITEVFKKSDVERADNYAANIVLKCFQHFCATGFTTSLTEDNLLTREGSAAHRKHQTIKRLTGCLNKKMPSVACQDVDRDGRLRKGLRHDAARSIVESLRKIRRRSAVHKHLIRRPTSHSLDR